MHRRQSGQSSFYALFCEELIPTAHLLPLLRTAAVAFPFVSDLASDCYFLGSNHRPRSCSASSLAVNADRLHLQILAQRFDIMGKIPDNQQLKDAATGDDDKCCGELFPRYVPQSTP